VMLPPTVEEFLSAHDFSPRTVKAFRCDLRKFVDWFMRANNERFELNRVTVRDIADFRSHLQQVRRQSVATVNRALVCVRRFLSHAVNAGEIDRNPAKTIKELRRMPTTPSGLNTAEVRRILREIEIRQDRKAAAIIGLMIHAGLRASEVVGLELEDITIGPRSGQLVCREGKGNKQRTVPLSVEARRVLTGYLESRPSLDSPKVFLGERGPLAYSGLRAICSKYSAITGVFFTAHKLRHTFARRFPRTNRQRLGRPRADPRS
jgi:site-specific recombinase XerD